MTHDTFFPGPPNRPPFELDAFEPGFPKSLSETHPPVSKIYGLGQQALLEKMGQHPGLAIVGSRQASSQGLQDAEWFATEASALGLTIISGLAQGIDAAAHRGAMAGPGQTIAVLAHGRSMLYPSRHEGLANQIIASGGCLITEYSDGAPALPHQFPARNRIIAALARAVLVVEAAPRSGSLITARHALDLGVDVFVLPGSIHMPQSVGCNALIRQGAQLVQSPDQLLSDLGLLPQMKPPLGSQQRNPLIPSPSVGHIDSRAQRAMTALDFQPRTVHELEKACQLSQGDLFAGLLLLELEKLATRLPDGRWLKLNDKSNSVY
jgi:DNA processing protein